jgi:phosphatidylglycerophosphate synthase
MSGPRRFVLCPANVLPQAQWLRTLRDAPIERSVLYVDASRVALLETADPQAVLAAVARHGTAGEILDALGGLFRQAPWPADPRGRFVLGGAGDVGPAEAWLLRSLIKSSEGFMSRHVERRVSLMITRRLVRTGITPNAMTLVSVGVGLAAAPFFLSAQPVWQLLGALVFLAHSILDGCDGELARLKFLESPAGAILDFWGDNVVHVAIFTCMTVGWARASQAAWPLAVGAAAVASVAVATAVLSRRGLGPQSAAGSSTAARVVDALSNRDFIYLVLALATVGKAWWFLALVAGGTPIFVLLALRAGPREAA